MEWNSHLVQYVTYVFWDGLDWYICVCFWGFWNIYATTHGKVMPARSLPSLMMHFLVRTVRVTQSVFVSETERDGGRWKRSHLRVPGSPAQVLKFVKIWSLSSCRLLGAK